MDAPLMASYFATTLFLNPSLFLLGINVLLSRTLPPIHVPGVAQQPPPYYTFGPSATHPHLDVHASDTFCWSYTLFMCFVQMLVYGKLWTIEDAKRESKVNLTKAPPSQRSKYDARRNTVDARGTTKHVNGNAVC